MRQPIKLLGKLLFFHSMQSFQRGLSQPWESQQKRLKQILRRSQKTQFGKQYHFSSIQSPENYQTQVPMTTYKEMKPYFELISQGVQNILFPDKVICFLLTSGTTGKPKLFPLSSQTLSLFKRQDMLILGKLLMEARRGDALSSHIFNFSAPEFLPLRKGCYPVGYITGVIANQLPWFLSRLNRTHPSSSVLNCPDWDKKLHQTALEVVGQDIRVMFGMPSNIVAFLRALTQQVAPQLLADENTPDIIKFHIRRSMTNNVLDLGKLWPQMLFLVYGGVHVEPYLPFLKDQFENLETIAVYWATEGALGLQFQDSGMNPSLDTIFFEFIPENQITNTTPLLLTDVRKNTNYRLIITTIGGLYRYDLGDIIRFTNLDPPTIEIVGRAGTVASIAGERLLESQLSSALHKAMEITHSSVSNFTAIPQVTTERTGYTVLVEFLVAPSDIEKFGEEFDRALRQMNFGYDAERKARVIDQVRVKQVKVGVLNQIASEKHPVNGAGKVPIISNASELTKLTLT